MYTFIIMLTYPIELHVTREVTALGVCVWSEVVSVGVNTASFPN